jgi:hypothetical protein
MFGWLVADGWCWFVLREEYCWLVAGGWFVVREKHCWLMADKTSEQGPSKDKRITAAPLHCTATLILPLPWARGPFPRPFQPPASSRFNSLTSSIAGLSNFSRFQLRVTSHLHCTADQGYIRR